MNIIEQNKEKINGILETFDRMIINGYSGSEGLKEAGDYALDLLRRYASAENVEVSVIG